MILKNANRYLNIYFTKQYITHEIVFFQFYDMGLKRFISDSPRFLWSSCSQVGWGILHREKKSCTSIGSCQRILYSKILHWRLRGISMPLLTHVLSQVWFCAKKKSLTLHWRSLYFVWMPFGFYCPDSARNISPPPSTQVNFVSLVRFLICMFCLLFPLTIFPFKSLHHNIGPDGAQDIHYRIF